ncbi:MAG TPA: hypothetical protein VGI10_18050 [Polyangiaceae bacterium]
MVWKRAARLALSALATGFFVLGCAPSYVIERGDSIAAGGGGASVNGGGASGLGLGGGDASNIELTVQEWGTFTSMQGPDGVDLGGLHHEDEALPSWVNRRNFNSQLDYYFEQLPSEPLQQLETPVLYFYTAQPASVHVEVHFNQGIVGQWYPDATSFAPALDDLTEMANGAMTWDVLADPTIDAATLQAVDPTEIWAPSRHVASTPIRGTATGDAETEQFIFYRGLGMFEPPVKVLSEADGTMHVQNASADALPAVFVLRASSTGGYVLTLGPLAAGGELTLAPPDTSLYSATYVDTAGSALHSALVDSGLKDDVAQAMVDTWTRSWFGNVGLRVLYVAPRAWADGWLPTTITPTPSSFTRSLVGRIEVITPADEAALVAEIDANASSGTAMDPTSLGRFAEPRIRYALGNLTAQASLDYANALLAAAHALP